MLKMKLQNSSFSTQLMWLVSVGFVFYGIVSLDMFFSFKEIHFPPVWLSFGFALCMMLLLGYRVWVSIFLGAFFACRHLYFSGSALDSASVSSASAFMALGTVLGAALGSFLIQKLIGPRNPLDHSKDVARLVCVSMVSSLVVCSVGFICSCYYGYLPVFDFGSFWYTWWLASIAGVLILTSVLFTWQFTELKNNHWKRWVETGAWLVGIYVLGQVVFGKWFSSNEVLHAGVYWLIPPVLVLGFRHGQRESVLAFVLIVFLAIWGTVNGIGPFSESSLLKTVFSLQSFLLVGALTVMLFVSAVMEHGRTVQKLNVFNEALQERVTELASWSGKQTLGISQLKAELHKSRSKAFSRHKDMVQERKKKIARKGQLVKAGAMSVPSLLRSDFFESPAQNEKITIHVDSSVGRLLPRFYENRKRDIEIMQESLEQNDFATIAGLSHNIKGVGASFGFELLAYAADSLEKAARKKEPEEVDRRLKELVFYFERTEVESC